MQNLSSQQVEEIVDLLVEPELWPHQFEAFEDRESRVVLLRTGYGGGKSHLGGLKTVDVMMRNPPSSRGLVIAPVYAGHELFTLPAIRAACALWGMKWRNAGVKSEGGPEAVYNKNEKTVTLPGERVLFLCTADEPEHAAGLTCVFAWLDEASQFSELMFQIADSRVRDPRGTVLQLLYTSTPRGTRSAMHKEELRGREQPGYMHVINAPTSANRDLPKSAIDAALLRFKHNAAAMRQFFHGIATDDSGNIYTQLTGGNIQRCTNITAGQQVAGWDFNVSCMTTPLGTWLPNEGKRGRLHIWGEVETEGEAYTETHARKVRETLMKRAGVVYTPLHGGGRPALYDMQKRPVLVFPDATGSARKTGSLHTDHTHVYNAGFTIRCGPANPPVEDRVSTLQHGLMYYEVMIDPDGAPNTLRAVQEHSRNKHGDPMKGADYKADEFQCDHRTDSLGYMACGLLPIRPSRPGATDVVRQPAYP